MLLALMFLRCRYELERLIYFEGAVLAGLTVDCIYPRRVYQTLTKPDPYLTQPNLNCTILHL